MLIFLLDDEGSFALVVKDILQNYLCGIEIDAEISVFSRPENLYSALHRRPDLLFTDIELAVSGTNGIEVAKRVKQSLPSCQVVFLTGYINYASDVYEADHLWFIVKDELPKRLPVVMQRYFRSKSKKSCQSIIITNSHKRMIVSQSDILYCESRQRKVLVVCKEITEETYINLNTIDNMLDSSSFLRCHNSFIVNLDQVIKFHPLEFEMANGDKVPISRRYKDKAKHAFLTYTVSGLGLGEGVV